MASSVLLLCLLALGAAKPVPPAPPVEAPATTAPTTAPTTATTATTTTTNMTAPADPGLDEARRRPLRVAVYALEANGIDPRLVRVAEASLLEEIRKLQRCSVLSLDEVRALLDLETQKQLAGCTESSCLSEIAEALGADALVTGGVTQVGESVTVFFKRSDPNAGAVVQTFTRQLTAADGEEVLAVVGPGVEALFPELPLRAGQTRGVSPEVALLLNPPPLSPAVFWTLAGVTGAAAVASAGAGALLFVTNNTLQQTYASARSNPVTTQQVVEQQGQVVASNIALWAFVGVTGAAAVATGFVFPFTDWQNLRSEQP